MAAIINNMEKVHSHVSTSNNFYEKITFTCLKFYGSGCYGIHQNSVEKYGGIEYGKQKNRQMVHQSAFSSLSIELLAFSTSS